MKKGTIKLSMVLLALLAIFITILAVEAANYLMVHQNPTVPTNPSLTLYQADNVTPITNGSDITTIWNNGWTGTNFTVTLWIHNNGNTALSTGFSAPTLNVNWTLDMYGNGPLAIGATQQVNMTLFPPLPITGGASPGDFDIYFTG